MLTQASKGYRDMYWTPDYVPLDTDLLRASKCTGSQGVPREEVRSRRGRGIFGRYLGPCGRNS